MPSAAVVAFGLAALLLAGGACGRKIGDSCTTSTDCDPTTQSRTCDMSQPGGYCVIEGCDARSCPEDSVCVRFFPTAFLTGSCDPTVTDPPPCAADSVCVPTSEGAHVCARRSLEKRVCVQSCGGDGDCRGEYRCRTAGSDGAIALTLNPASTTKFCVPK